MVNLSIGPIKQWLREIMSEMRISIRLFDASKSHSILIDDETIVDGFLAAIVQT